MPPPKNETSGAHNSSLTSRDLLLLVMISLVACSPLYVYGVPYVGDLPHHYRIALGFYESILSGNFYPSWLSTTNGGYGDPSVRFYPPALYFLLSWTRVLTRDWYLASLVTSTLITTAGVFAMYFWTRSLSAGYYAFAAGLLYVLSPFHANEMYQAGMYGQYAAGNVLPFVFGFVEQIIQGGRRRSVAGLGLSYGLVILFHVPLAVLGSIAVGIYALIRLVQTRNFISLNPLVKGVLLGVAVSCCYWLPVIRELKWKHPSGVGQGEWFNYKNNFLFQHSPSVMSDFLLPMLTAGTFIMAMPALVLLFKKNRKALAPAVVAMLALFLATPLSKPIWEVLPILQETQFPWRWMTVTSACFSLLVTISFPELAGMWRSSWRPLALALIGLVIIALSFTILQLIRGAPLYRGITFDQKVNSLKGSRTNPDFLPIWAHEAREMEAPVEAGTRLVTVIEWASERRIFSLDSGPETEVRLKTYYYPYWMASAGGKRLATRPAEDGALLVVAPAEKTTVEVKFTEPLTTSVSGAVSVCALLLMLWLVASNRTPSGYKLVK